MDKLTPISEMNVPSMMVKQRQLMQDAINKDWYFEGKWQKLLVTFCFIYTAYSILISIWRFLF
jgi:hypothetical protein